MKSKKWRIGSILLAVVILAGTATGISFANTVQTNNSDQSNKPDFTAMHQNFITKFAANLGVSQDKVTEALEATKKQMIDEAVQQGKLTQEQADKMKSDKGLGFFGFGHGRGHGFVGPGGNPDDAAKVLGISADQLKTLLQSGKKIEDIVTEHGMTMDQFREKMQELKKEAISKAVSDGKLTQEQADKMIQRMEMRFNRTAPTDDNN